MSIALLTLVRQKSKCNISTISANISFYCAFVLLGYTRLYGGDTVFWLYRLILFSRFSYLNFMMGTHMFSVFSAFRYEKCWCIFFPSSPFFFIVNTFCNMKVDVFAFTSQIS